MSTNPEEIKSLIDNTLIKVTSSSNKKLIKEEKPSFIYDTKRLTRKTPRN